MKGLLYFTNGWIEFDTNEDYEKAVKWAQLGEFEEIIDLRTEKV